jgi:hypothetical protein
VFEKNSSVTVSIEWIDPDEQMGGRMTDRRSADWNKSSSQVSSHCNSRVSVRIFPENFSVGKSLVPHWFSSQLNID